MTFHHLTRALAGVGLIATALNAAPVRAAASDYRFEIADVKQPAPARAMSHFACFMFPTKSR